MKKVIFATGNQDKMGEIRSILCDWDMEIQSMREAGIDLKIVEDGKRFEETASIKANAVAAQLEEEGVVVFADDSGLEIDYLGKEPGIYSARYLGEDTPYKIKNQKILERMEGVPKEKRTARFVCAIAAADKHGEICVTRGTIEGYIGWEPSGANGFGYDPIFYLDEYGCSTAELSPELKNQLSHRGKALSAMRRKLESLAV